jgi:hypothetical protein
MYIYDDGISVKDVLVRRPPHSPTPILVRHSYATGVSMLFCNCTVILALKKLRTT